VNGTGDDTPEPVQVDAELSDPYGFPPTAAQFVGGYFADACWESFRQRCPAPAPERIAELVERQLAALNQTYPAWRIRRVTRADGLPGGWWATRYATLTTAQRATGLVPSIARADVVSLVMELAVQDEIAHQTGYATEGGLS
jgi:hypothetical protein